MLFRKNENFGMQEASLTEKTSIFILTFLVLLIPIFNLMFFTEIYKIFKSCFTPTDFKDAIKDFKNEIMGR